MKRKRENFILVFLGVISALSGILGNVASNTLPDSWKPYLWISWILLALTIAVYIRLSILDRNEQENAKNQALNSPGKMENKYFAQEKTEKSETQENKHLLEHGSQSQIKESDKNIRDLFETLNERCNLSDIRDICFFLGIDYDNYPNRKSEFIRELLLDIERQDRLEIFIESIKTQKPWVLR